MKVYILRKSLSDLKHPTESCVFETAADTLRDFLTEMVTKNYAVKPSRDSLKTCIALAHDEFTDGAFYVVNHTKNIKYAALDEDMNLSEDDEIMLIKLKLVRGVIW